MINQMNFKSRLRENLRARGMTASDLSRATGIPKQSISDWLAGVTPRNFSRVKKVAEIFGVTVDELLFGEMKYDSEPKIFTMNPSNEDGWVAGVYEVRFRRIDLRGGRR